MVMFYDGTDSEDFQQEETFVGLYYGDVLDDDAFVPSGDVTFEGSDEEAD